MAGDHHQDVDVVAALQQIVADGNERAGDRIAAAKELREWKLAIGDPLTGGQSRPVDPDQMTLDEIDAAIAAAQNQP